ncbi:MAG: hypothetical protein MJY87_02390 [Fibrobacter sp.]|nr:hypothetical protein [Fibrobacter sp.]
MSLDAILEYLGLENSPEGIDQLNEALSGAQDKGLFERFSDFRDAKDAERRAEQQAEALAALEQLKAQNARHPTAKRTKMIRELEARYRANGVMK